MLASTHGNTDTIAMSGSRKKLLLNTVFVKLGCGTCRRPNLCRIFHPKPKPKNLNNTYRKHKHSSSSSSFFSGQWGGEDKCDSTSTTPTPTPTNTTFSNPIAASSLDFQGTRISICVFSRALSFIFWFFWLRHHEFHLWKEENSRSFFFFFSIQT